MVKGDNPLVLKVGRARSGKRLQPLQRILTVKWWFGVIIILLTTSKLWQKYGLFLVPHVDFKGSSRYPMSTAERESLFLSVPCPESAIAASRAYATHPHLAGAVEDFADAQVMLKLFQTHLKIQPPHHVPLFPAGSLSSRNATLNLTSRNAINSAWIDIYYPVLNTPLDRRLEILGADGKPVWSAELEEDGDPLDEDAAKYKDAVPVFHGLSSDGDVEGQLVFAEYGRKSDYDELIANGANLSGKIVIVRYGKVFRGLKIKGAQELGAVGVLIYSDPRDDGVVSVEHGYVPYPAGPARNPTSVQRGSVQFISMYPGDPTTPGYPAYENATRTEGVNFPKIPSLPISWRNGQRLLEEISDLNTMGVDGRTSVANIHLVNHVDTKVTPIWNTMASIPGHLDEVVIIACHRDAWVMGASDPISGTVSLHEVIRSFGVLLDHGWKPLRTIVFASWDGEEYGLVGSTEWGEDFAEWISEHAVAYLNVDVSASGSRWNIAGSPSLAHLIRATALDIEHPTIPGMTLWDARNDTGPFRANAFNASDVDPGVIECQPPPGSGGSGMINRLGSGSDYTVFLQRLGVASADQGFRNTRCDAPYHYHSIYDSERWNELYADPGFHRHVAVAKHLGLTGLRLVDSIIIPLNTTHYTLELGDYLDTVERLASISNISINFHPLRKAIGKLLSASVALDVEKNDAEQKLKELLKLLPRSAQGQKCRHGRFRGIADRIKWVFGVDSRLDMQETQQGGPGVHSDDADTEGDDDRWIGYLASGIHQRDRHGPRLDYHDLLARVGHDHGFPVEKFRKAAKRVQKANRKLIAFEHGFISEEGIKDRTWYRHLGVAPGKWLGYGATVLPALNEALTLDQNVTLAEYEAKRLTDLIEKLADKLHT